MSNKDHFFIKLGKENYLFDFFLKKEMTPHLIIGHGSWRVPQFFDDHQHLNHKGNEEEPESIRRCKSQIKYFMNSSKNRENSYFWIFHKQRIYVLQPISEIFDIEKYHDSEFGKYKNIITEKWSDKHSLSNNENKFNIWRDAKLCKAKFVEGFEEKIEGKIIKGIDSHRIIHQFASINANQAFNRKTIAKLDSVIADEIIECVIKNKIKYWPTKIKDKINYLSPIQLETLVFLCFYEMGYLPSTYRGGTGKDYDILLNNSSNNQNLWLNNINYISVKFNKDQVIEAFNKDKKTDKKIYIFAKESEKLQNYDNKKIVSIIRLIEYLKPQSESKIIEWIDCQLKLIPFLI